MQKITSTVELRTAILSLEIKKANEGRLLKEEIENTFDKLRPSNLIKNTLKELTTAPDLKGDLLNATIGLAAGYLSKKAVVGETHNPIKQLLGTLLQIGVTSIVSKNADGIKSIVMNLINNIMSKKDKEN